MGFSDSAITGDRDGARWEVLDVGLRTRDLETRQASQLKSSSIVIILLIAISAVGRSANLIA